MARYSGTVDVGDVLVTREGLWIVSFLIRLGARLTGLPALVNHAIIVHHKDPMTGTWVGIEGRPGGVGWRDLSLPLTWALTNANTGQPKTPSQRYLIATAAEALINAPYDWQAIEEHVRVATRIRHKAISEWKEGEVPGHVVCSSYADWCYERVGLANPGGNAVTRMTSPALWDQFITYKEWETK